MNNNKIGRPLYIIDGYNVVFNSRFSRKGKSMERLRDELVKYLDSYRAKRNVDIVVIWDGESGSIDLSSRYGGSRVKSFFSRKPENADSKIVKMVAKYEKRGRIIVVSNDRRHITQIVKSMGSKTMSVEDFLSIIGYNESTKDKKTKHNNESLENSNDKLIANDLTIEEWLEIFKSKQKKGE